MNAPNPFAPLLATPESAGLGPGPRAGAQPIEPLARSIDAALAQHPLSPPRGAAARALILLWHDHHDAAHGIVQDSGTAEASYVHGILHRREPDYGNAKYWFRRAGRHAWHESLAQRVAVLLDAPKFESLRARLLPRGAWDAFAFVDACAAGAEQQVLRAIQAAEFERLLDFLAGGGI